MRPKREVRILHLPLRLHGVTGGPECACCGAVAARSRLERLGFRVLVVAYCEPCLGHASRPFTRDLSAALAGCLLGSSVGILYSAVFEFAPLWQNLLAAALAALLPAGIVWLWPYRRKEGHTAALRAVWWRSDGSLVATRPAWAARLVEEHGGRVEIQHVAEPPPAAWVTLGAILALTSAPVAWRFQHPLVRVLNFADRSVDVRADAELLGRVPPTSAESPAAGVVVRVPAGERALRVKNPEGAVVFEQRVRVQAGAQHLFVPIGVGEYCFWLERDYYGRRGAEGPEIVPLPAHQHAFWVLPPDLTTWFAPNPPPLAADSRSTGGELLALRQARCTEAPEVVERAQGGAR